MERLGSFRTFAIVALLVPGLVMAAPIAGPCGHCGGGDTCHMKRPVEQESENHSCCGEAPPETPPEPSLGFSDCECGRDAPPAVTVEASTVIDTAFSPTSIESTISPLSLVGSAFAVCIRPPAPPPTRPAYLIDCAFLT